MIPSFIEVFEISRASEITNLLYSKKNLFFVRSYFLILVVVICFPCIVHAQADFRPGYVIKNSGDTIYGTIDYRERLMSTFCRFKEKDQGVTDYLPGQIAAFRFIDSKYYVSREVNGSLVFLEYLIKGQVSIYHLRDKEGDHYFLDKKGEPLREMPYEEGLRQVDGKSVHYESKKHIGLLTYYMSDAPVLHQRIASMNGLNQDNLISLAEDYHHAVCEGEECVVYEKKLRFLNIYPEVFAGFKRIRNGQDEPLYFERGVVGHIWMPRANEKLYLRTGVVWSQEDLGEGSDSYFVIPLQMEYIYPKGIVRPRLSYGYRFFTKAAYALSSTLGVNVHAWDHFAVSLSSNLVFSPSRLIIVPGSIEPISYSFQLGLFFNY